MCVNIQYRMFLLPFKYQYLMTMICDVIRRNDGSYPHPVIKFGFFDLN